MSPPWQSDRSHLHTASPEQLTSLARSASTETSRAESASLSQKADQGIGGASTKELLNIIKLNISYLASSGHAELNIERVFTQSLYSISSLLN